MSVVLAGFIGRPRSIPENVQGYETARYQFSAAEVSGECRLFSIALRQHLINNGRAPQLWLLLGTPGSIWDALAEIVPEPKRDDQFDEFLRRLHDEVRREQVQQSTLDEWSALLSKLLSSDIKCRITGEPGSAEEPAGVFAALEQNVRSNDEIVFDVTHGLRHQPIVASFSVLMLRWLRGRLEVDFRYGAFELRKSKDDPCPVLSLPVCQQLAEAGEAIATYHYTGSFQPIGTALCNRLDKSVPLVKEVAKLTDLVAYSDEVNHPKRDAAGNLISKLGQLNLLHQPVENALAQILSNALQWLLRHPGHDEQMLAKSREAMAHRQRFKAVAFLYEAICSAICRRQGATDAQLDDFDYRDTQYRRFLNRHKDKKSGLNALKWLRGAVLHGTAPTTTDPMIRPRLDKAIDDSPQHFRQIFDDAAQVCDNIIDGTLSV